MINLVDPNRVCGNTLIMWVENNRVKGEKIKMNKIKKSLIKNKIGILLMLVSSICACIGQLFWKLSLGNINLWLIVGFIFYGVGAIVMITAYKFGDLSVLQPILSLNYILSVLLSIFILNEPVTLFRVIGILIILVGATLIGGGDN